MAPNDFQNVAELLVQMLGGPAFVPNPENPQFSHRVIRDNGQGQFEGAANPGDIFLQRQGQISQADQQAIHLYNLLLNRVPGSTRTPAFLPTTGRSTLPPEVQRQLMTPNNESI